MFECLIEINLINHSGEGREPSEGLGGSSPLPMVTLTELVTLRVNVFFRTPLKD